MRSSLVFTLLLFMACIMLFMYISIIQTIKMEKKFVNTSSKQVLPDFAKTMEPLIDPEDPLEGHQRPLGHLSTIPDKTTPDNKPPPEPVKINTHMMLDVPEPIVYDLIIILGVIPRMVNGKEIDYLEKAMDSLYREVSKYPNRNILIYVQNNDPDVQSSGFARVKSDPKFQKLHFIFHQVSPRLDDPFQDDPNHDYMDPNNILPGHKARQQICDVASIIDHVTQHYSFDYALFMEDDFVVCPKIFEELFNTIDLLKKKDPLACGIRISYGMSGIVLKRADLKEFREYAFKNMKIMPIDNALQWFWLGKDSFCQQRKVYTFHQILMEHIGDISTFPERNSEAFKRFRRRWPTCGEFINNAWNLNAKELFDNQCQSRGSKLSPC